MKGLIVNIYRSSPHHDGSNDGISNRFDKALLVGEDIALIDEANGLPIIQLKKGNIKGQVMAYELDKKKPHAMFGGAFIYTSDSRFKEAVKRISGMSCYGAIPLHDRYE